MRSFFCEKCRLEFDLDEDFEEGDDTVFCPQCKINLAVMLPETPERIVMRERRLRAARIKQLKELFRLVLFTLAVLAAAALCLRFGSRSAWLMLVTGLPAGIAAGLWVRRITFDRTFRAGILGAILALAALSAMAVIFYLCGRLVWTPALPNLTSCIITAWIFAVYEKRS